jgi:hypothetical protein
LVVYVWLTGLAEPELTSPKLQLNANGLVPPVVLAVIITGSPAIGLVGLKLKSTPGTGLTVMVALITTVAPTLSVAVTVVVNVPAAA